MAPVRPRQLLLVCVALLAGCSYESYAPPPVAFSGDSTAATQTAVVPTLDTPAPKGKNVIWCGTTQLAWDELRKAVGKVGDGESDPWARLNSARMNPGDLPAGSFYAAAGDVKDGIIKKIQADMSGRFPGVTPNLGGPDVANNDNLALAYAYLAANVKFRTPYIDQKLGADFVDSLGRKTRVSTFGCDKAQVGDVAGQIAVLHAANMDIGGRGKPEFILDLDKNSKPSQIILARVEPRETLAATWQYVRRKIQAGKPGAFSADEDSLVVPNLNFRIEHRFKELEIGPITEMFQSVDFRLDRSGATLISEAFVVYELGIACQYDFTRPFLIVMRKRGSVEPYFVMWVDNAELLCKQMAR